MISEEEMLSYLKEDPDVKELGFSEQELRESVQEMLRRVEATDPTTLERGESILHMKNPYNMYVLENRGETILVEGIPPGGGPASPEEFEVPSDEVCRVHDGSRQIIIFEVGPEQTIDLASLFGDSDEPKNGGHQGH